MDRNKVIVRKLSRIRLLDSSTQQWIFLVNGATLDILKINGMWEFYDGNEVTSFSTKFEAELCVYERIFLLCPK